MLRKYSDKLLLLALSLFIFFTIYMTITLEPVKEHIICENKQCTVKKQYLFNKEKTEYVNLNSEINVVLHHNRRGPDTYKIEPISDIHYYFRHNAEKKLYLILLSDTDFVKYNHKQIIELLSLVLMLGLLLLTFHKLVNIK